MYPVTDADGCYVMPPPDEGWLESSPVMPGYHGLGDNESEMVWGVSKNLLTRGYSGLGDLYSGPFPDGVPNPFVPMLHSYPTRYHGPIYTRPVTLLPWRERPYDFAVPQGTEGLGQLGGASGQGKVLTALLVAGAVGAAASYDLQRRKAGPATAVAVLGGAALAWYVTRQEQA